jgi:hypothetical protein
MQRFQRPFQRRFQRISWLDSLVYGFQHRWETNPQYRAAASGVAGLGMVLVLCACLGILTTAANAALAGFGVGSGNGLLGTNDTGTGKLAAGQKFPTATPPALPPGSLASGTIPNSQTPKPGPTARPTEPDATPTQPGGGGGVPTKCDGGSHGGTWAFTPCPLVHGQGATLSIHAANAAGRKLYVLVSFNQSNCTLLWNPTLDGAGTASIPFTVLDCGANSQVPISGEIDTGLYIMGIAAAPVQ